MEGNKKKNYIEKSDFLQAMTESQSLGQPTEKYAEGCMLIANHLLQSRQFRGYSIHLKEDMLSNALVCCMKAINKFNIEKTNNAFGYITRTIWTSFIMVLRQHYRYINLKNKLMEHQLELMDDQTAKRTLKMWNDSGWKGNDYGNDGTDNDND